MKKKSKTIKKDYTNVEKNQTCLEYYGILIKNGRARIDTKRYRKFFEIPDTKIEHRKSVYYLPTKKNRDEYYCNRFYDLTLNLKNQWINEYSEILKLIKTPKDVEDETRVNSLMDGVLSYEEACNNAIFKGLMRKNEYQNLILTIYSQFYQQMMSQIDALSLKIIVENGYQNKKFSREEFDTFIQGKQEKSNCVSFFDFKFYYTYNKAYRIWNFLKHNSEKAYNSLKKYFPELICDPNNKYRNGDPATSVLKIDDSLIIKTLEELPLFFDEVCEKGFKENPKDAKWDYDEYFIDKAKEQIELIENPLDLPKLL